MRLHRFFIPEIVGSRVKITINSVELLNQLRKVFRLKTSDRIVIFDGSGSDYECSIADFIKDSSVDLDILSVSPSRYMPSRKIFLCASIVKKDNFEFIVEKATELGVTDIVPIIAERSEKKALNGLRLNKIATEASEQSGRGDVPVIHKIMELGETLADAKNNLKGLSEKAVWITFHTEGETLNKEDIRGDNPVIMFIGPEGGWSQSELSLLKEEGVIIRCLGPQVLRAETAVVSAISQVVFS